ncbi:hypothetical protein IWQ62_001972 [Dispira parvispora]|uniref:Uncharacterized protein n=1 Tax=Dispira parvispora TaxID=1520584 RepID=A0A9W8E380_9FUNG|nr:hypothetical protein IWQ62_001972 [Dispira parvispora]
MASVQSLVERYRDVERHWFQTLHSSEQQALTLEPGERIEQLTPETIEYRLQNLGFYAEVAFMLLGLKPAVLFWFGADTVEGLDVSCPSTRNIQAGSHEPGQTTRVKQHLLEKYVTQVCRVVLGNLCESTTNGGETKDSTLSPPPPRLALVSLPHRLCSPEMDLQSTYICYNRDHPVAQSIMPELLNPAQTTIEEKTLQRLLDYPGTLPTSPDQYPQMIYVEYLVPEQPLAPSSHDTGTPREPRYLCSMSYIAQRSEIPAVRAHFLEYRQAIQQIGLDLRLCI